jgi:hypothetical protein
MQTTRFHTQANEQGTKALGFQKTARRSRLFGGIASKNQGASSVKNKPKGKSRVFAFLHLHRARCTELGAPHTQRI